MHNNGKLFSFSQRNILIQHNLMVSGIGLIAALLIYLHAAGGHILYPPINLNVIIHIFPVGSKRNGFQRFFSISGKHVSRIIAAAVAERVCAAVILINIVLMGIFHDDHESIGIGHGLIIVGYPQIPVISGISSITVLDQPGTVSRSLCRKILFAEIVIPANDGDCMIG